MNIGLDVEHISLIYIYSISLVSTQGGWSWEGGNEPPLNLSYSYLQTGEIM